MDAFLNALNLFFTTFKAAVFVPVFIFVIALAMGVKPKKAFFSALSAGVGLEGFSLVIGTYSPILQPIISNMINSVGINLPIVDLGWQTTSIIAYSYQVGMIYIAVAIALQVILYLIRYTTIFQAGDLWNNYSYFAWGSCLFVLTGSFWLAMACMVVQQLYTLLCTEIIAKRWSTYYGYPNCSIASLHTATCGIIAVPLNLLLDKLGLYKTNADPQALRQKLGFIGEPMTLGLFLGLLIGVIGDFNKLGELATWGEITTCGIATAAVMAVFPKVSGIFAGSFSAITEAGKKKMKKAGTGNREWYLAVNDATGYGEAATLITGILLMPVTLLVAFILPGNLTLPMLDLVAIPYIIQPFVACSNGNIVKSFIGGLIFMIIDLYCCSLTGAAFTQVAVSTGIDMGSYGMITSLVILGQPVGAIIFMAFLSQNPITIAAVVAVYVVCYILVHKNMDAIHAFIENSAVNHQVGVPAEATE
ncbi:PTS transporter subunit IIC [Olsenella sp. Marseille-P4559]|uniref:PTS transporter subunit IIC n=1 Tax=Olsenella sp. Marseille-P4559 TaxID=2364795 RepID=UPI001030A2C4|nr:PTS transporter subunit IIC [Olsenella sp. Marseille-P4559]